MRTNKTFWHWSRYKHKLTHRLNGNAWKWIIFHYSLYSCLIVVVGDSNDDSCTRALAILHSHFTFHISRVDNTVLFIMWKIIMKIIVCNSSVCWLLAVGFRNSIIWMALFWIAFVLRRFCLFTFVWSQVSGCSERV